MKNSFNKFNLVLLLSFSSIFAFGQTAGHQIKATIKANGTAGQVDVYLTSDFSNSTEYFTNIVLAFGLPTAKVTSNTTVTMINSQITSLPTSTYAIQPKQVVGSQTIYPFTANNSNTTISAFTSGTEFKIGTFQFNDATMNMSTVSLVDFSGGNPGGWLSYYAETNVSSEISSTVYANKFYSGSGGTAGGSGTSYYVTANTQVVLPVTLVSFTAVKVGTGNNLNWLVSSETNAKGYDVERSSGNGANFTKLGSIAANNNGKYSFIDASPLSGVNYYRLKMTDIDGKFKYSEVRTVLFDGTTVLFDIYPNPVVTSNLYLHIQQYNYVGKAQAIITDIVGRNIQSININIIKGNNQLPVTVKGLNSGTYFVTVYDAKGNVITETKKLVKP